MADPHIADDTGPSRASEPSLLVERGADDLDHPGGTLGAHLRRVAARLVDHGVDETTRRAGLWHAAYGTDGFPTREQLLTNFLPDHTDRTHLRFTGFAQGTPSLQPY